MPAVLFLALLGSAAAQEDPSEDRARRLYEQGTLRYEQGAYEEALVAFELAYRESERPLLLYNMASTLERLGRWQEALDALREYRTSALPEELATLDSRIANLEERIGAVEPEPEPVQPVESEAVVERRGPSAGAVALLATGAVGVGLGTAFTVRALSARSDWRAQCVDGVGGDLCPADVDPLVRRDRSSSVVADVSWVVGVGALGGGVLLSLGGRF